MELEGLLQRLWDGYVRITPQAERIHALLAARGERIVNDHVAFRTFNVEPIGIDSLAAPFLAAGYRYQGEYDFPEKQLYARSYAPPGARLPRLFISELRSERFSAELRAEVAHLAGLVPAAKRGSAALFLDEPTWPPIAYERYQRLLAESEYAAWVAAFGLRVNHFTVLYNALASFASLAEFSRWLQGQGFSMNESGGLVKGTPAELLEQSSTLAGRVDWTFAGGDRHTIPSCYYEFARRYPDPKTGELYPGFIAQSADKIFESTDVKLQPPE
jgi:hypothetical protein